MLKTCKRLREANGYRKRCCAFKRYCYGKRCKNINKKCKTGKLFTYSHFKKCFLKKVVRYWKRKVCCAGAKKCVGTKCKLIRRICKVTNFRVKSEKLKKIQQLRISKWKSEKVDFFKKIKHECFCFKQEEQNLKYMRIKRSETSKKYQRCRKLQNKKKKKSMAKDKCIRIFDNIKYFSDKAIKQRSLRNKKKS